MKIRKINLVVITFLIFYTSAFADMSNFFFKVKITLTDNIVFEGFYKANYDWISDSQREKLFESSDYFLNDIIAKDRTGYIELYETVFIYNYCSNGDYINSLPYVSWLDIDTIEIKNISSIILLDIIDSWPGAGVASVLEISDSIWYNKVSCAELIYSEDICNYYLIRHDSKNIDTIVMDKIIDLLKENKLRDPYIIKLREEKYVLIAECSN
jgi:hypothetical protein